MALKGKVVARPPGQSYVQPPDSLKGFPDAHWSRPKTGQGAGRRRKRWKDAKTGNLLEWDYQHGAIEMFDRRGNHLGEFDPDTGEQRKPPDPTRRIDP
jgi:hypothetical protein